MANKITLDGPSVGVVRPELRNQSSDAESEEVSELREQVLARTGARVPEATIRAILSHRQARTERESQIRESSQSYHQAQSQEALEQGTQAEEAQRRLATGLDGAKGLDRLTPQERESIRNPRSGAILPPLLHGQEPIESGPASAVLEKILDPMRSGITVRGESFETVQELIEAYAASVQSGIGTETKASSVQSRRVSLPSMGSAAGAMGTGPAGLAAPSVASRSGAKSSSHGNMGAVTSGAQWASSAFNWDAFCLKFMMRSMEDDHSWRRSMKVLRQLDTDLAVGFKSLEIALTEMKQANDKQQKMLDVARSGFQASDTLISSKKDQLVGKNVDGNDDVAPQLDDSGNPGAATDVKKLDDQLQKLLGDYGEGQFVGRTFLSDAELATLPADLQTKYRKIHENRSFLAGDTGTRSALRYEIKNFAQDDPDLRADLNEKLKQSEATLTRTVEEMQADARGPALLAQSCKHLFDRVDFLRGSMNETRKQLMKDPENQELQNRLKTQERAYIMSLDAATDLAERVISKRPGRGNPDFAKYLRGEAAKARGKADEIKAKIKPQQDQIKGLDKSISEKKELLAEWAGTAKSDDGKPVVDGEMAIESVENSAEDMTIEKVATPEDIEALKQEIQSLENERQEILNQIEPDLRAIKRFEYIADGLPTLGTATPVLDKSNLPEGGPERIEMLENAAERAKIFMRDQSGVRQDPRSDNSFLYFVDLLENPRRILEGEAIRRSGAASAQLSGSRKEVHGMLQSKMRVARGMIDQLMNLLAMARTSS